jgi:[protein-PII] uridylyltransferase
MFKRLSPARIDDVVDGRKLRAQLSAAALSHIGDEDGARRASLQLLHGALFRGRIIAKERLEAGAGGHETARLLAQVADEVIKALFDFTTTHVFRSRNPTAGERFAVVATGGYGRGQLAPSSDIDLLFLRAYKPTPWAESVTESMLYALWDMSLKVGHASRSVEECLKLAREDHTIQTALLEARHLAGDESLSAELLQRFRHEVALPGHRAFVAAKLRERNQRHERAGATPYMVEPNIKEGPGGLRDLHTLFWILRHRFGFDQLTDYVRAGVLAREELVAFLRASELLWRVRCHLHYLTGRAEERLTFDLQPEMAARLGFRSRSGQEGVERFMKRYFLAARDVSALSRILTAKLEDEVRSKTTLADFFTGLAGARSTTPGFVVAGGRITAPDPSVFDANPLMILRLFEQAGASGLDIHPEALAQVSRRLRRVGRTLRRSPEAQAAFLAALATPAPARVLTLMHEAGVLGRFVPEFGRIVAQMQFNMYHHYTVDAHTLRAVDVIQEIEDGKFAAEHPLATSIFPKIINRRALYLAMLLHDTGKGAGDQQIEGAKSARAACERLGLPESEIELVAWLVRHHLVMSDVAQKRDIGDPRTIANFARLVGDVERLRLLLVLTVADIRAVGPGVWNSWKGQLLRDVYRLAEAALHGGRTDESSVRERLSAQAEAARGALAARLSPATDQHALEQWLAAFEDAYWVSFDADELAWHAAEAAKRPLDGPAHAAARPNPTAGVTDVLVLAPDRKGLFGDLAEAFFAAGGDVRDARAFTTRRGSAFDLFSIQDAVGGPFGINEPGKLARLCASLVRAAKEGQAPQARPAVARRHAAFAIEPWVRIDNEISLESTVIEVSGRDRRGVLAELARALTELRLSIVSAHIDNYGERVADVFYVQSETGGKLTEPAAIEAAIARLTELLRAGEPAPPATAAREPLAVARASDGR